MPYADASAPHSSGENGYLQDAVESRDELSGDAFVIQIASDVCRALAPSGCLWLAGWRCLSHHWSGLAPTILGLSKVFFPALASTRKTQERFVGRICGQQYLGNGPELDLGDGDVYGPSMSTRGRLRVFITVFPSAHPCDPPALSLMELKLLC